MSKKKNKQMTGEQAQAEDAKANPVEDLQKQVEELKAQIAELNDKELRMMAEFDNYRRRTNKEKLELMETAGERIFKDMLPLVDDLERAMARPKADAISAVRGKRTEPAVEVRPDLRIAVPRPVIKAVKADVATDRNPRLAVRRLEVTRIGRRDVDDRRQHFRYRTVGIRGGK